MVPPISFPRQSEEKAIDFDAGVEALIAALSDMSTSESLASAFGQSSNQQTMPAQNLENTTRNGIRNVNFGELFPSILPQLDKNQALQLKSLYNKLRRNEVTREDFLRLMTEIVGAEMIKMAVYRLITQGN